MPDLDPEIVLALRLILAAALGALIGAEREIHDHPAGMRTHLLVAVGSALFTALSIYGFVGPDTPGAENVDPTRIAAQVVTGIGFLGAGAIIKEGFSVRGLTTAASLWATAAIGMAAGAGQPIVAIVGTAIVLVSLWPLNAIADRMRATRSVIVELRVTVERAEVVGELQGWLRRRGADIRSVDVERGRGDELTASFDLRLPGGTDAIALAGEVLALPGVLGASTETRE